MSLDPLFILVLAYKLLFEYPVTGAISREK